MDEIIDLLFNNHLTMKIFFEKNKWEALGIFLFILVILSFFDKGLAMGFGLLFILSIISFFILNKLGFKDLPAPAGLPDQSSQSGANAGGQAGKKIHLLFLIVLAIHLATTLFMHYANFQPFAGGQGDELGYQRWAVEASESFNQGIFSIKDIVTKYPDFYTGHYYPVIIGALYALTMPEEIIGLMLNVWLVALTVIFVYLIILEIGGSKNNAFIIGLVVALYPSYVFNSGLLLKDTLQITFVILGLLFLIKTIKKFTRYNFLVLYLAIFCATHFRFYIGYALILTFLSSWFLFSNMGFKQRIRYGIIFIVLLGFIPQLAFNQGYYGINSFWNFLNFEQFKYYRQMAWNPIYNTPIATTPAPTTPGATVPTATVPTATVPTATVPGATVPGATVPTATVPTATVSIPTTGFDSSFSVEAGFLGYAESFVYVLLGPFPLQIKYARQSLALIETIPWYLLLFFIVDGIIIVFKKRVKGAMPLLIFSIIVMIVIAIFDKNFGLIVRIRIPVFISLLCIASLSLRGTKYISFFEQKILEIVSIKNNGKT